MISNFALLFTTLLFLVGCGATQFDSKLPDSYSLKQGQTIEFPPIENVTGKTLDPPADQIFNEYMANLLKDRKLLNLSAQPAAVVLKSKLIEYEPGSAFGRWLLPGLGTTACTVDAELLDKQTGALIGEAPEPTNGVVRWRLLHRRGQLHLQARRRRSHYRNR